MYFRTFADGSSEGAPCTPLRTVLRDQKDTRKVLALRTEVVRTDMESSNMMQAPRRVSAKLFLPILLTAACGGQMPSVNEANQADVVYGTNVHKMPMSSTASSSVTPYATASDLTYRGGAVISNVQTVQSSGAPARTSVR